MPKSKRTRTVALSKVKAKVSSDKSELVDRVRESVDTFKTVYALGFQELRSNQLQAIRTEFRDSRLFFGKNKIIQLALGHGAEDEYADNLRHLSGLVTGNVGLLATNRPKKEVLAWFAGFEVEDFAKQGFVARGDLRLEAGPIVQFPVSMCPALRKLGLSLQVDAGTLKLLEDFTVTTKGTPLTAEQAKLCVHLGLKLVKFQAKVLGKWEAGGFEELEAR